MTADRGGRGVEITRTAQKGIHALPAHALTACRNLIRDLAVGTVTGKKLKGDLRGLRSVRIGRSHRLLYRETPDTIEIIDVGPRGDIYRK